MVAEVASIEVTLRLLGAERFQASMRDSGSVTEQTGARVKRAMDGIATSTDRVSAASSGLLRSNTALNSVALSALRAETSILGLNRAFTLLGTAVGGLAGGVALNAFKNYADTATNIQNRLATVIPVQQQRAAIDQQIFDTAQRTRTSYESTANIFARMSLSASTLGASQSEILRTVEITQKALQAGGATVSESASIATQLTQALGSGRLNGDELKSISENSTVLIKAIADEFGVSVGALKDLGEKGELEAGRVFRAILRAGKEVDEVFARSTPTIAAGIQQIDNALTRYIGNVDKSIGATKALVGGLEFVAKNLDTIGDSAALAVAALAGPLGARLLGGAGSRVAAPFRAAGADAREGLASASGAVAATRAAREAAQVELQQAQRALAAMDEQPRFRQAAPDVQQAYERQASKVDQLREAATKTAEREAEALLKRAETEGVVAQASETASSRAEKARARLAKREADLQDLIARRAQVEAAAALPDDEQRLNRYLGALAAASDQKALITQIDKAMTDASVQGVQSVAEQNKARVYAAFQKANSEKPAGISGPLLKSIYEGLPGMNRADAESAIKGLIADRVFGPSQFSSPKSYRKHGITDEFLDLGAGRIDLLQKGQEASAYEATLSGQGKLADLTAQRAREVEKLTELEKEHVAAAKALSAETVTTKTAEAGTLTRLDQQIAQQQERVTKARDAEAKAIERETNSRVAAAARQARAENEAATAAIAATSQRRAAQQALSEAEGRLGGLAGQVGTSAAAQRTQAIREVEAAQAVLNRAYFAEQEAVGRAEEATKRASVAKVALAGTARAVTGAVSGMVAMLGGPLGAALTAASVGLVGYELYQARATARVEEHTRALDALAGRLQAIKGQQGSGELRSDQDLVADRVTLAQAMKAARDRRDSLLAVFDQASQRNTAQSDLGGGVFAQGSLDKAAANLGVNLSQVVEQLRTLPPASAEAASASELLNRVLTEAATIDPRYGALAVEAEKLGISLKDAGTKLREFEEARRAAAEAAKGRTDDLDVSLDDFATADIDAAAQQGRDTADAFAQGFSTQIPTGSQISDSIAQEGARAKEAFQEALGQIDTETLDAALRAVGSSLETVKGNLDGTKVASGEAGAASIAFAQALQLIQANQPDLSATIAQITAVTNAYRQMIGLQSVAAAGPLAPGSDAMTPEQMAAAVAKQREASLKKFNERLEAADKTPAARQRRIGRALPGLTDAEISRLDAAENPARGGRRRGGGRKSPEQRDAETLSKKLEELDQDASVAALNDFDQKTVRFAQSAKVASEQIQAFIAAAKSGDMSGVPPVMQEIYDKMRLLEGVKLGKAALDDLFPGRLLEAQIESVRRAAANAPEIAANLDLIEQRLREKNAPEWAKDTTNAFSDMVKSVASGTATMADALSTLKTRIVNLALDAALKPLERLFTSAISGGGGFSIGNLFGLGGSSGGGGFELALGGADDVFGGLGAIYHSGGEVGVTPVPRRALSMDAIRRAPRFHAGLGSDEFAAVLQRGERVLTGRQDARTQATMSALADAASQNAGGTVTDARSFTFDMRGSTLTREEARAEFMRALAESEARQSAALPGRLRDIQRRAAG